MAGQSGDAKSMRSVAVKLQLESGHQHALNLKEDSPELATLFRILASRGSDAIEPAEQFLQLPMDNGHAACSFNSQPLVSVITEPPVLIELQQPAIQTPVGANVSTEPAATAAPVVVDTPRFMIIDDFLAPDELQSMLDFAISTEDRVAPGTAEGMATPHRQNKVVMDFGETTQSQRLRNRLLTYLPIFSHELGVPLFPVSQVESQLTASNDGHYYRIHCDAGAKVSGQRVLSCVYYLFREPRPFSGGALRLYDAVRQGDRREASSRYRELEAVSNRLVVFPSTAFHELTRIRCPSRRFADSRFAITNWIHGSVEPLPDARFGWGHLRSGVVPPQFEEPGASQP